MAPRIHITPTTGERSDDALDAVLPACTRAAIAVLPLSAPVATNGTGRTSSKTELTE